MDVERNSDDDDIPDQVKKHFAEKKRAIENTRMAGDEISTDEEKILTMTVRDYYSYMFDNEEIDTDILEGNVQYIDFSSRVPRSKVDLFQIKKVQIEMMKARGYDISHEEAILDYTLNDFDTLLKQLADGTIDSTWRNLVAPIRGDPIITFRDKSAKRTMFEPRAFLTNVYKKIDKSYYSIVIYLDRVGDKKYQINKPTIEPIKTFLSGSPYNDIIFITAKAFSKRSRNMLDTLPGIIIGKTSVARRLWIFGDRELTENPTLHSLNGDHELLSLTEAREFKRLYVHSPQISIEDPIVKFYGWKIGQVVKITRDISSIGGAVDTMIAKRLITRDNLVGLIDKKHSLVF